MSKWIPLPRGEEVPCVYPGACIVTTERQKQRNVEFAYPGWTYHNNNAVAIRVIEPITANPTDWLSEYRGDEPPVEDGWYLVTVENNSTHYSNYSRYQVKKLFYKSQKQRWIATENFTVVGYMLIPKPYKGGAIK
jgi:hypothetical protein